MLCGIDEDGRGTYTADGIKAIAESISVSPAVTSIDVGLNVIGRAASLELLAAMKGKSMVNIGMAGCSLGVEGSKVVAEMISVMPSITSVSLLGNYFDIETATMLLQMKEGHAKLKTLCGLTHEDYQILDYQRKGLGPGDAMLLAPELQVMPSLTKVLAFGESTPATHPRLTACCIVCRLTSMVLPSQ